MTTTIPKVSSLSSRVIRVLGCNPGYYTLQGTNTYIIGTGKQRLLIDTGEPDIPEYLVNLKRVLIEKDISLTKILLTHWHPDHVGGTKSILQEVASQDCKVYKYKDPNHDSIMLNVNELTYLKDEEVIEVEGATIRVHLTPGHTQDHLCCYLHEENNLFSGDCVLGEGTAVFEDLSSYLQSLEKMLTFGARKFYPGHGPVVDNPVEKIGDYIRTRLEREKQIIEVLNSATDYMSSMDIVHTIYTDLPGNLIFGADYNVRNHLKKLILDGRVDSKETDDLDYVYKLKK